MMKELKRFKDSKKGSVFAWFTITVSVFAIALIYLLMTQPIIEIQGATWDEVQNDTDYATTYNTVVLVWKYWPIVMLLGLIIIGIVISLKREPYTGYERL